MSYQLKRIDPFWHTHPMIPTGVVIGGICGAIGFATGKPIIAGLGGVVAAIAILAAAKPVVSALLATLGLFGGLVTFVFVPNVNAATMSTPMRLAAALLFALFYMVLMDGLVLVVSALYNFFAGTIGFGGVRLELAEAAEQEE